MPATLLTIWTRQSGNLFMLKNKKDLRDFLEKNVQVYNDPAFIPADPISVPHRFSKKQDVEIAGLFSAVFSWGNQTTIIRKSNELMNLMDDAPYDFILNHKSRDLKRLLDFKHRTFNSTDLLYFIHFLKHHYSKSDSLEAAFFPDTSKSRNIEGAESEIIKLALSTFYNRFFSLNDVPDRTRKHISSPEKNSTCKRLNMYLRWMVRSDSKAVDFGIWKKIKSADLICPVDVHVARVARKFGLISRKQTDWETAMELTRVLRSMDPADPVKYDFALFGLGVMDKY
jgi:uncharacterized protein (TIGR02757 family)